MTVKRQEDVVRASRGQEEFPVTVYLRYVLL